jgi:dipeptidyl-peptidase-3
MRDRALIAHWCYENGKEDQVIEIVDRDGKTFIKINDYEKLRQLFGKLLSQIQDIKSLGKYNDAKMLVEKYGIKIDQTMHQEVKKRYALLDIAPYSGFVNPQFIVSYKNNVITDIQLAYTQTYIDQMLDYGKKYRLLLK